MVSYSPNFCSVLNLFQSIKHRTDVVVVDCSFTCGTIMTGVSELHVEHLAEAWF